MPSSSTLAADNRNVVVTRPTGLNFLSGPRFETDRNFARLNALGEIRGRGLLLALDLKIPIAGSIVTQAFEHGVLLNAPRPDALRFMPALNVTREEISAMIECLDAILTQTGAARRVA